jgi:putative peptide zinc metalloprotease protein
MKPQNVTLSALGLAVLLLGFFIVPLPVTRVREVGVVQVQPDEQVNLHVELPAILKKLHVREGEEVKKGKVLAEFFSPELETKMGEAKSQQETKENLVTYYRASLPALREAKDRQALKESLSKAEGDLAQAQANLRDYHNLKEKLTLRAPMDGVVMGLPKIDEVGKYWDREQAVPFCSIGDPTKLRVLVAVPPADYDLMRENKKTIGGTQKLPVTVRVQGLTSQTWDGEVTLWPESEARTIPLALSSKGGGPLAVKPMNDPNQLVPQAQVFLVGIDIRNPDTAICPGAMAQVKIHCKYRSCAWWTWRTICNTFDLGLL